MFITFYKKFFTQFTLYGGGGGGDPGAINRIIESQREAAVEKNRKRVNEIFDGPPIARKGINVTDQFDVGRTYYDAQGNIVENPGDIESRYQAELQAFRDRPPAPTNLFNPSIGGDRGGQGIDPRTGFQTTAPTPPEAPGLVYQDFEETGGGGFDDEYFGGIADAYVKFQTPLLEEQIQEARRIQPANYATTRSSAYLRNKGLLEKQYGREQVDIADRGQDFSNQHRIEIERNRSDILNLANSTTDSSAIARAANARVSALSTPPAFSPIGDVFQKFTRTGTQLAQANQIGNIVSKLNYGAPKNAVRTVT